MSVRTGQPLRMWLESERFQEMSPNHQCLESKTTTFSSGDVLCSYESLWLHCPGPTHAYQGCLVAGKGALKFWFAFACGVFLTDGCTQLADTFPGYIKKNHNVRSHLPVSSTDMQLIQLSYLGSQWKLSPGQMKDVPLSWVHIVKWMWCNVTSSTLACGDPSGNAPPLPSQLLGHLCMILDREHLGKGMMQTNQRVFSIKSASKFLYPVWAFSVWFSQTDNGVSI